MVSHPQTWQSFLERERELRSALSEGAEPDQLREWFSAASHILEVCAYASRSGRLELIPPAEVFAVMANLTNSLARGIIPGPIADIKARGRPKASKREEMDIGWASVYIRACKAKIIDDSTPIKTICDRFLVERQTAQSWANAPLPSSLPSIQNLDPDIIKERMAAAAIRYSQSGRSASAIEQRSRRSK